MKTDKAKGNIIKQARDVIDETARNLGAEVARMKAAERKRSKVAVKPFKWDFPITADVGFFDAGLSYELTGYRPITKEEGLDFDPEWFMDAKSNYLATGHYTSFLPGSKSYRDFWHEEYRRCKQGYTVNGYTVTGDHYFFLNYYQLPIVREGDRAGSGRIRNFPEFFVSQYQFFHYVDLAKRLHKHIALMKARGIGFSEISAAMAINQYTTVRESVTMIACYDRGKLDRTLAKAWQAMQFLDDHTDGGMFKLRQLSDTALVKKSGHFNMAKGNKIPSGWQSVVEGVVADDPQKIRGDRVDLMILDEGGCHAPGTEVLMYDCSTKKVEDVKVGDKLMGPDGTERTVLELHSGTDQMYKLVSDNKDVQIVNSSHILYGKKYDYNKKEFTPFSMTAKDYYAMVQKAPRKGDGYKFVKTTLDFPKQEVPIPPYIFGFWLGDGDTASCRFSSGDPEVIKCLQEYAEDNGHHARITPCKNTTKCYRIYLEGRDTNNKNWFMEKLKALGVFNNKFIPDCYLYNDRESRLQLIAGLMDSDGTYCPKKHVMEFTQYIGHKLLFDQAVFICRSLGLKIALGERYSKARIINGRLIKGGILNYRLRISYGHSRLPTLIPRKQSTDRQGNGKGSIDKLAHSFKISKANIGQYYGFSVDKDQLFVLKDFTVCHNSWPSLLKAFVQAQALVEVQGVAFGTIQVGGERIIAALKSGKNGES